MKHFFCGVLFALATGFSQAETLVSLRLTDTVDKGIGEINLFKNVGGTQLEAYRSANQGFLVFAVDINEAANGTEKSKSQGVAVSDAWLDVTFANGVTRVYGHQGGIQQKRRPSLPRQVLQLEVATTHYWARAAPAVLLLLMTFRRYLTARLKSKSPSL